MIRLSLRILLCPKLLGLAWTFRLMKLRRCCLRPSEATKPACTVLTALSAAARVALAKGLPAGAPFLAYAIGRTISANDPRWATFLCAELTGLVCMGVIVGAMRPRGAVH